MTRISPKTEISFSQVTAFAFGIFVGLLFATCFISTHYNYHWPSKLSFGVSNRHHEEITSLEDFSVAKQLSSDVKILCWIMTNPSNHQRKAMHVKNTWGKRCNKLLFMSSEKDALLGSVGLNVSEGRDHLWDKTKAAFQYVYDNHLEEYDWFLKADDDTYVIVENLRYLVYAYSPNAASYFGFKFKFKGRVVQGYMSGGAGYILSREAVRRFIEKALPNENLCPAGNGPEDLNMGDCLEKVGVIAGDSRDSLHLNRFFPFTPWGHLTPGPKNEGFWYWSYIFYKSDDGLGSCSNNAVSFHYIEPRIMYFLEYLIYFLQPYGIVTYPQPLPRKVMLTKNGDEIFIN